MLRIVFLVISLVIGFSANAIASENQFFKSVQGKWAGPGEIVAGKYKGTRFTCVFDGISAGTKTGMNIDGYCRVGMFSQPMNALIEKAGGGYRGRFLDGEAGEGMDIVGGKYTADRLVVNIKRKDLVGVMVASKANQNHMQFTISVKVDGKLVPVIGMRLDRTDGDNKIAKRG